MRRNRLYKTITALLFICVPALSGCGTPAVPAREENTVITVLADNSVRDMDLFWANLAARFPNIKLEVTVQNTLAPADEIARRVAHGDVADLVFSQYLDAGIPGLSECFMDLSGKSYISRYQTSYLNALDVDGSVYCLPADLTVQGIVYNQTFFDENGLEVPGNYEEFAALCARIQDLGVRPGMLLTGNRAPAELFSRCYLLDKPHSLKAWEWARQWNDGTATVREGELGSVFDMVDTFSDLGLTHPDDYTLYRLIHMRKLANREVAMVLGNATAAMDIINQGGTDIIRLMPVFSPADGKGYFFIMPLNCLAVGRHVEEDPEKAAAVDLILEYITSEEGERELMELDKGIISPVSGMRAIEDEDFYQTVKTCLTDETMLNIVEFSGFAAPLNLEMERYLRGETDQDHIIQVLDDVAHGRANTQMQVLAAADQDFTLAETNALALEAMREALDTDLALIRQSSKHHNMYQYCINATLYEGPVTETDIMCIYPGMENPRTAWPMARLEMTGAQLLELLSYEDAYYYNGVTVRYQWDQARGGYAANALLDREGNEIGPDERLTAAFLSQSPLGEQHYLSWEESSVPLWTALEDYMKARKVLTPFAPNPVVYEK